MEMSNKTCSLLEVILVVVLVAIVVMAALIYFEIP